MVALTNRLTGGLRHSVATPADTDSHHLRQRFINNLSSPQEARYVYTYPYKGAYRPFAETQSIVQAWRSDSGPLNIYVHVPYCEMKCGFCNLFTTTQHTPETFELYANALIGEIQLLSAAIRLHNFWIDSIYFGGGTPTLLPTTLLARIIDKLRLEFVFGSDVELAIEAAPNSVNETKLNNLKALGFRRISFGIQSFTDEDLRGMHRDYEPDTGRKMACAAIAVGFENVNIDLIYGLPRQSRETWMWNVESALQLGVQTITMYPLVLRTRTDFGKKATGIPIVFPRPDHSYGLYDAAVDLLSTNGYQQQTMVAFAKPNGGSRHEFNEFLGIPTLGIGVAALSYARDVHYTSGHYFEQKPTGEIIAEYLRSLEAKSLPIRSGIFLDGEEAKRRYIILRLSFNGISREEYRGKFAEDIEERFGAEIEILRDTECIEECDGRIFLSPKGRRFTSLIADLFASDTVKELATGYH